MQMPSDDVDEGKILQVAQDGYLFNDKVLRHAKVLVSKADGDSEEGNEDGK